MSRISKLITKLGGPTEVARRLGKTTSVVGSWVKRGRIPINNWAKLIEIGASKEELVDANLFDRDGEEDETDDRGGEVLVAR